MRINQLVIAITAVAGSNPSINVHQQRDCPEEILKSARHKLVRMVFPMVWPDSRGIEVGFRSATEQFMSSYNEWYTPIESQISPLCRETLFKKMIARLKELIDAHRESETIKYERFIQFCSEDYLKELHSILMKSLPESLGNTINELKQQKLTLRESFNKDSMELGAKVVNAGKYDCELYIGSLIRDQLMIIEQKFYLKMLEVSYQTG